MISKVSNPKTKYPFETSINMKYENWSINMASNLMKHLLYQKELGYFYENIVFVFKIQFKKK